MYVGKNTAQSQHDHAADPERDDCNYEEGRLGPVDAVSIIPVTTKPAMPHNQNRPSAIAIGVSPLAFIAIAIEAL